VAPQRERDGLPLRLPLQIQDELVFEVRAELAEGRAAVVRAEMERARALRVPLRSASGTGADRLSTR
jgi:DNA polymerase-1